jgi:hypothetical protein
MYLFYHHWFGTGFYIMGRIFAVGRDESTELTDTPILEQVKMSIAAVRMPRPLVTTPLGFRLGI